MLCVSLPGCCGAEACVRRKLNAEARAGHGLPFPLQLLLAEAHTCLFLPAGYYAVVVGKRSEAASTAIARAYPAERLLRLGGADLDAAAAAAAAQAEGGPAADPLQVSG